MRRRRKHLTCRGRTGDTCIVTCLKGFEGGSGQHTCGAYGIFVGTAKPCKRRKCAALTVPGAVSVCTGVYQDVCTPSCAKGYTPSASMAMTCSANGTFVGGAKCTMRHCDPKFVAGRQHSLVHINCVAGGCSRHFKMPRGAYTDKCSAEDKAGVVDLTWTCCAKCAAGPGFTCVATGAALVAKLKVAKSGDKLSLSCLAATPCVISGLQLVVPKNVDVAMAYVDVITRR